MNFKGKRAAVAAVVVIGAGIMVQALNMYIERNRAIAVFNDMGEDYTQLLQEGLPDEHISESGIKEIINKILGFDIREPQTVMESSSAIFEETGADIFEEVTEEVTAEVTPEVLSEQLLPTFTQISTSTGITVNNATSYVVDANAICSEPLYIRPTNDGPQVLIVHSHTTECYDGDNLVGESDRTTDEMKNMTAVGAAMKKVLEEYGIQCIHDTTVHDYPTYQGAYTRELATVERILSEYPSIKIVLDIHRDAFIYSDGSKLKLECEIGGETIAKAMLVCGTDAMGLSHPNWRENFKLAAKIQNAAQLMYPGMMRPINLRRERFNMHTTTGSLLIEVGANGNTLPQAIKAGKNVARAIAAVLTNQQ